MMTESLLRRDSAYAHYVISKFVKNEKRRNHKERILQDV